MSRENIPDFKVGDTATADAMNALLWAVRAAEQKVKARGISRGKQSGGYQPPDRVVHPWRVELQGDKVRVRTGRLVWGYGTDTSSNVVLRGAESGYGRPFSDDWVEVDLPAAGGTKVVWLAVWGHPTVVTRGNQPIWPPVEWWGEIVKAPGVSASIVVGEAPGGALRCFPLAVLEDGYKEPTQLMWGDLDMCGMWALQDEHGQLVEPRAGLGPVWGDECKSVLCGLHFETTQETVDSELRCCMDEYGAVEFNAGRCKRWQDFTGRPPDGGQIDVEYPVPPSTDDDRPGTPPRKPRRKRRRKKDPGGYWYEGGHGIGVMAHKRKGGSVLAYDFECWATAELVATLELYYNMRLGVTTSNSIGRYDWPEYGAYNLQMYYGVTGGSAGIGVSWRSSFWGADQLPKSAQVERGLPVVTGSCAPLLDGEFWLDSEHGPGNLGNIILARVVGTVRRRGVVWEQDPLTGQRVKVEHVREFKRVKLDLNERKLLEIARNKIIQYAPTEGAARPESVTGVCSDIDPPVVRVSAVQVTCTNQPSGETEVTGPLQVSWGLEYTEGMANIPVTGSGDWNWNTEHGEINAVISAGVEAQEKYVD
ncbi:MAG: hypothetical protein Q3986_06490 [Akkermansia sp.]|nr:hypothetical protein [Akkermansia sp.]